MSGWIRASRATLVVIGLSALSGCMGMGVGMGDVLGTGTGNVSGEVRRVDERSRVIQVSNWFGGSDVRYDGRTQVIYNGRQYPVRALERGDRVSIRVSRNSRGTPYADRIYVERSIRDTRRTDDRRHEDRRHEDRRHDDRVYARVQYVEGRVNRVDQRQGWMEIRPDRGSTVRVSLPARAQGRQVSQFRRLRRGDYVRLEGVPVARNRLELVRIL